MQPPERRGFWYALSALSPVLLFLGLKGRLGPDAREESATALGDWARVARSPIGRIVWLSLLAIAGIAAWMAMR